ncbi:MAG TPA: molybdate ABC transporter substrate-binding protein [Mycobacteriales bacterium]|jgi:molybdate transport system substrate-binding protein|nr:molybdate ABC transporter substrate-binding protein [Mycobacteriales bacterium]
MRRALAVLAALLVLAACTPQRATGDRVTVLAAASLTGTFTALGKAFEDAHPGTVVEFSFGASSTLARQITDGAPADVFAAADTRTMRTVTDAGLTAGPPQVFARNRLTIAVPAGNPGRVRGLADFARPQLRIAICAPQVPCGSAAARAFAAAGITPRPDTLEQDVKAALAKVVSGEVDAALVYRTDVRMPEVDHLDFPEADRAVNDYPIALLRDAPGDAAAFRDYVLSPAGRRVLTDAGFDVP